MSGDGGAAGSVELLSYPISSNAELERDLAGGTKERALRRHARRYYRFFAGDRKQGCPGAYVFRPLRIKDATVAGRDGVRYGFIVEDGRGAMVERTTTFVTTTKSSLVLVVTTSVTPRACVAVEGDVLRPAQLRSFEPYLARLAANGKLPKGT